MAMTTTMGTARMVVAAGMGGTGGLTPCPRRPLDCAMLSRRLHCADKCACNYVPIAVHMIPLVTRTFILATQKMDPGGVWSGLWCAYATKQMLN
jgi:hypothetical protein